MPAVVPLCRCDMLPASRLNSSVLVKRPMHWSPSIPQRIASRILGMGDVMSLIEDVERKVDQKKAEKFAKKMAKGKGFDLEDLRDQLQQMNNLGGMAGLMDKLAGYGEYGADGPAAEMSPASLAKMEAIIGSMTVKERRNPDILNGSRKRRITHWFRNHYSGSQPSA